jgi:hypothetical protein
MSFLAQYWVKFPTDRLRLGMNRQPAGYFRIALLSPRPSGFLVLGEMQDGKRKAGLADRNEMRVGDRERSIVANV